MFDLMTRLQIPPAIGRWAYPWLKFHSSTKLFYGEQTICKVLGMTPDGLKKSAESRLANNPAICMGARGGPNHNRKHGYHLEKAK